MDFNDYRKYLFDHFDEIAYDIKHLNAERLKALPFTEDELQALTYLLVQTNIIMIQNYHQWIEEHQKKPL